MGTLWYNVWSQTALKLYETLTHFTFVSASIYFFIFLIILILYQYLKNKKIQINFIPTPNNREVMKRLSPIIHSFSPTVYFLSPYFMMKWCDSQRQDYQIYLRQVLKTRDHEEIAIDWFPRSHKNLDSKTPIGILCPGVCGDSRDSYAVKFCQRLYSTLGWKSCVFNKRGFANMPFLQNKYQQWGILSDFEDLINSIVNPYLDRDETPPPIFVIGFSKGANYSFKYIATQCQNNVRHYVSAYCSVSNPFDLKKALKNSNGHLLMNSGIMKLAMNQVGVHLHEELFVENCEKLGIDLEVVMKSKTILEFEERFSRRIFGYYERDQYHQFISCKDHVRSINIPTLVINSANDPVVPVKLIPQLSMNENPNIISLLVGGGGHVEYCTGLKARYWSIDVAIQFFKIQYEAIINSKKIKLKKIKDVLKQQQEIGVSMNPASNLDYSFEHDQPFDGAMNMNAGPQSGLGNPNTGTLGSPRLKNELENLGKGSLEKSIREQQIQKRNQLLGGLFKTQFEGESPSFEFQKKRCTMESSDPNELHSGSFNRNARLGGGEKRGSSILEDFFLEDPKLKKEESDTDTTNVLRNLNAKEEDRTRKASQTHSESSKYQSEGGVSCDVKKQQKANIVDVNLYEDSQNYQDSTLNATLQQGIVNKVTSPTLMNSSGGQTKINIKGFKFPKNGSKDQEEPAGVIKSKVDDDIQI